MRDDTTVSRRNRHPAEPTPQPPTPQHKEARPLFRALAGFIAALALVLLWKVGDDFMKGRPIPSRMMVATGATIGGCLYLFGSIALFGLRPPPRWLWGRDAIEKPPR